MEDLLVSSFNWFVNYIFLLFFIYLLEIGSHCVAKASFSFKDPVSVSGVQESQDHAATQPFSDISFLFVPRTRSVE